ncbi:L30e-like protein [Mycena kentingensis (nom. inval.)]|nr:L30e-like protein [Mycena kentingensis (nom. inval.)]
MLARARSLPPKSKTGKKPAPSPFASKASKVKKNPLFEAKPRNFGIGQDIQPQTDLTRFVKWPAYVRLQRQKVILSQRLKVPPAIAQFSHTLDKNTATQLFKLLNKYRPESKAEKKTRLTEAAAALAENKDAKTDTKKPLFVKYGLNHIVALIEAKKASLVVIAHDVDPIELVVFLPALCRKMGVPYVIVKGKARLGTVVHKKTAAVVALQDVKSEDTRELATLVSAAKANFTDKYEEQRRQWGGGVRGNKSTAMLKKRAKASGQTITSISWADVTRFVTPADIGGGRASCRRSRFLSLASTHSTSPSNPVIQYPVPPNAHNSAGTKMADQPAHSVQPPLPNGDVAMPEPHSSPKDDIVQTQEAEPAPALAQTTTTTTLPTSSFSTATVAAAAAAANTPASLAALLATALTDVDSLREELATTRQRAERAERLLATFGLVGASMTTDDTKAAPNGTEATAPTAPTASTTLPQATVTLLLALDERTVTAERERDELSARLTAITGNWAQFESYSSAVEMSLRDARRGYARIVLDSAEPGSGSSHDYDPAVVSLPGRSLARAFHGISLPPLPGQGKRTRTESMMSMDAYVPGKRHRGESDYDTHGYSSRRGTYPPHYRTFPNHHLDRQATIPNTSPFTDIHRSPQRQQSTQRSRSRSRSNSAGSEDLEAILLDASGAAHAKKERSNTLDGRVAPVNPNPGQPFPARNAQNQRLCRQCGLPGRYKDGRCVEKWGPGPMGPGTVCDRCRKRAKRVERRGTGSGLVGGGSVSGSMDTLPIPLPHTGPGGVGAVLGYTHEKESSIRSSLAAPVPSTSASRPASGAPSIVGTPVGAPNLLPPLRTHSPMEADDGMLDADADADGDAEAEVDELEEAVVELAGGLGSGSTAKSASASAADADFDMDLLEAVDAAERGDR